VSMARLNALLIRGADSIAAMGKSIGACRGV
jgi:hypothetical protein